MGDFNWVSPQFVAFASPQSELTAPISVNSPAYSTLPSCIPEIASARINQPFKNVLSHFVQRNVGLVVRLNSELYCPSYFTAMGIQHLDMIFEDGTCPQLPIVRKFIKLAHDQISKRKAIAVHCKAGLGRTGCLIGAYLIYRHGFTANEVIAYMRFMRPGMVVGPQQHWLHMNQNTFREWQFEDTIKAKYEKEHAKPATPLKLSKTPMRQMSGTNQTATPRRSSVQRAALGEIDGNDVAGAQMVQDENLPAPTPGQPRKYARMDPRGHDYQRSTSAGFRSSMSTSHHQEKSANPSTGMTDSDEEFILQRLAARRSQSKSPNASAKGKGRSVSYTTTTTTTTKTIDMGEMGIFEDDGDAVFGDNEVEDTNAIWADHQNENMSSPKKLSVVAADGKSPTRSPSLGTTTRSRTPRRSASGVQHTAGSGVGVAKTRSVRDRESPMHRSTDEAKSRVRKTSGRVGSQGQKALTTQQQR